MTNLLAHRLSCVPDLTCSLSACHTSRMRHESIYTPVEQAYQPPCNGGREMTGLLGRQVGGCRGTVATAGISSQAVLKVSGFNARYRQCEGWPKHTRRAGRGAKSANISVLRRFAASFPRPVCTILQRAAAAQVSYEMEAECSESRARAAASPGSPLPTISRIREGDAVARSVALQTRPL